MEAELPSSKLPFVRWVLLLGVLAPPACLVLAMVLVWQRGFSFVDLALLVGMYLLTGFGITIGFHRYFAHKSFDAPRPIVFLLGILGTMGTQGPIFWWVATHRCHHHHSDEDLDPHSPYAPGDLGFFRGFWHAHMGWLFRPTTSPVERYVPDLREKPMLRWIDTHYLWVVAFGIALPVLIGGLVTMSWWGALTGGLWGGVIRIMIEHHATWSVNSICHIWGTQPFDTHDESRNNPIIGVVALGEGWHNNHHAFPSSARHGLRWWQFDTSWLLIRLMRILRLVSNVKTPSLERIQQRRRSTGSSGLMPANSD